MQIFVCNVNIYHLHILVYLCVVFTFCITGLVWEFKRTAPVVTAMTALSGFGVILYMISTECTGDGEFGPDLLVMALAIAWRLKMFWVNMCQTYYVLKKFKLVGHDADTDHSWLINDENKGSKVLRARTLEHMHNSLQIQRRNALLNMRDVLTDDEAFDLFVRHCGNEHCLECVLSVIEFIQFKQKIYHKIKEDEVYKDDKHVQNMEWLNILPDTCPQSDIVYGNDNFKLSARNLYVKYIRNESEWEINISATSRKKYILLMENGDKWLNELDEYDDLLKLYELFDLCIIEMIFLMKSAFSRFKNDDKFLLLQKKNVKVTTPSSETEIEEIQMQNVVV